MPAVSGFDKSSLNWGTLRIGTGILRNVTNPTTSPRENMYRQFTRNFGTGIHYGFKPTNPMRSFFGPWPKIFSAWWLPFAAPKMRPPRLPSHEAAITKPARELTGVSPLIVQPNCECHRSEM